MEDFLVDEIEDLIHVADVSTDSMPVIPLRGISIFPTMLLHFDIGREKSVRALEAAMMSNQLVFLVTQKDPETDLPTQEDFYGIGVTAKIKQMLRLPGNAIRVLVEGISRGRIEMMLHDFPYFRAEIENIPEDTSQIDEVKSSALMRTVLSQFSEYLEHSQKVSKEIFPSIEVIDTPGRLADIITANLDIKTEDRQEVLALIDILERLERVSDIIGREIEVMKMENDITNKVKQRLSDQQKEYYLKEQIKTIQQELGQDESVEEEVEKWLERLASLKLEKRTHEKVEREIKRMLRIQSSSPDAAVLRNYIECILELPWNTSTKEKIDLKKTKKILDDDHYGLEKVKDRIVEYLAVMSLSKNFKGPIICLAGPPGVGKTSIARSIARSINRKFVRMSLGGVRDEAEIRGHRRTYVGAIPGRIITSIRDVGVNNPVFLLDEIDKVGSDHRGDPAAALLEVLDPEQNRDFKDHFLDIPFDLSKVLFITTANNIDTIPRPLLDRMEVIQLSSYTEEDKVQIAKRHLIPKQIKENGLKEGQFALSESAVRDVVNHYTRESGVRNLEREIGNLCRKVARKVVEAGPKNKKKTYRITSGNLDAYLGKKKLSFDKVEEGSQVGMTTGLAWTAVGGDTLFIETTIMNGTGKLVLTGLMGDVMQESAKAGLSVIRARCEALGIAEDFYKEKDIHIHIPEGATPKDGPSAGVTMCTSMVSALSGVPVRCDVAMTGEITLRGKVLPVGGIKEKVIAAHRAGVKTVLLPEENMKDLDDVPAIVKKHVTFKAMKTIDEVLAEALVR
ncbi:MAG: endopeptidase La [Firmicutes bacterium]|nr:endopeptidase La [Bacillota bacterium]